MSDRVDGTEQAAQRKWCYRSILFVLLVPQREDVLPAIQGAAYQGDWVIGRSVADWTVGHVRRYRAPLTSFIQNDSFEVCI